MLGDDMCDSVALRSLFELPEARRLNFRTTRMVEVPPRLGHAAL
jgi:hypothetical protein